MVKKNVFFFYVFSATAADLSDGLVAISIEDSESNTNDASVTQDESKKEEPLLPLKMCYEWKDITQEFFEAVKGILIVFILIFFFSSRTPCVLYHWLIDFFLYQMLKHQ